MSVHVRTGLLPNIDDLFRQQLIDALSRTEDDWEITIENDPGASAWDASVRGPDDFHWAKRFVGVERDVSAITETVRIAIEMSRADLSMALAELVKAGMAYTTETDSEGHTIYVIDRIRLREEELIKLKNLGALTRDGIRHYLVDRAA
jgi:hypothetical protein